MLRRPRFERFRCMCRGCARRSAITLWWRARRRATGCAYGRANSTPSGSSGCSNEGQRLLAEAGAENAAAVFREALGLWRGPALADLAFEPFAQTEIARLEEQRLTALQGRIEADLALGRHGELIAELEQLVGEHPLRERLHWQLMLALYRGGRQADALAAYRRARTVLDAELGLEPGPELRRLEEAILHHDPSLGPPPDRIVEPPSEPDPCGSRCRGRSGPPRVCLSSAASANWGAYASCGCRPRVEVGRCSSPVSRGSARRGWRPSWPGRCTPTGRLCCTGAAMRVWPCPTSRSWRRSAATYGRSDPIVSAPSSGERRRPGVAAARARGARPSRPGPIRRPSVFACSRRSRRWSRRPRASSRRCWCSTICIGRPPRRCCCCAT